MLESGYYDSIQSSIHSYGGTDTLEEVASGVANAIYNTVQSYLSRLGDRKAAREFASLFEVRRLSDTGAGDRMIDWLVAYDGGTPEFLSTLLSRLRDVLSRPPA